MNYLDDPLFQTMFVGGHALPGIWRYMLPKEFAGLKIPRERLTTCDNCPMAAIGAYTVQCRCCTHFAQIPNLQLGLALKDPRSRELTRAIIRKGYALPEGIDITPTHFVSSVEAYKAGLFGKSVDLLCAFADADIGKCGIYPYRSAICATFHCGHDHCDAGAAYWDKIEDFVGEVETALSQWAMGEAGLDAAAYIERRNQLAGSISALSGDDPKAWSPAVREHLFGDFYGREETFFEACADQAAAHRNNLWQIACNRSILTADKYDSALDNLIAKQQPAAIHTFARSKAEPISIPSLWRQLQLSTDMLWALPNSADKVVRSEKVFIEANPQDAPISRLYANKPFRVICRTTDEHAEDDDENFSEVFLTAAECTALSLFETPRVISQSLLETAELSALETPEDFLSECLRCGILRTTG